MTARRGLMMMAALVVAPVSAAPGDFAMALAERDPIRGPAGWAGMTPEAGWRAVMAAPAPERQAARWDYARALIHARRGAEAFAVLETMRLADPDLMIVAAFRLGRGAALTRMQRNEEALVDLASAGLAANPEACAWRSIAMINRGDAAGALNAARCALPALRARAVAERHPFAIAATAAALSQGDPRQAQQWVRLAAAPSPTSALMRGHIALAHRDWQSARTNMAIVAAKGREWQRADAALSLCEARRAAGQLASRAALQCADGVAFRWRGGPIERRALRLAYAAATALGDDRQRLVQGARLLRYYPGDAAAQGRLGELQALLGAAVAPGSKVPLVTAAGLFWEYRDLLPAGAASDRMTIDLASRLEEARLYRRAADLLTHQMVQHGGMPAAGPLSVRVATLYILAGQPQRAVKAIDDSDQTIFAPDIIADRRRIAAVALAQLGRDSEAIATLDSVPGSAAIVDEIRWRRRDWAALAAAPLPPGGLDAVGETLLLRRAVAAAMIGDEAALAGLRARHGAAMRGRPGGNAFAAITGGQPLDGAGMAQALASLPATNPAGLYGDLLALTAPAPAPSPAPPPAPPRAPPR